MRRAAGAATRAAPGRHQGDASRPIPRSCGQNESRARVRGRRTSIALMVDYSCRLTGSNFSSAPSMTVVPDAGDRVAAKYLEGPADGLHVLVNTRDDRNVLPVGLDTGSPLDSRGSMRSM